MSKELNLAVVSEKRKRMNEKRLETMRVRKTIPEVTCVLCSKWKTNNAWKMMDHVMLCRNLPTGSCYICNKFFTSDAAQLAEHIEHCK